MFFRFGSGGGCPAACLSAREFRDAWGREPAKSPVGKTSGRRGRAGRSGLETEIRYRCAYPRLPSVPAAGFQQLFCLVESGTGQIQIERATVYPPARPLLPQRPEPFGVLGRFQAMRRNRPPAAFALDFERNPTLPRTALPFSCCHPCFEVRAFGDHLLASAPSTVRTISPFRNEESFESVTTISLSILRTCSGKKRSRTWLAAGST